MAKKPTVTTISSGYASNTQLNANFVALRDAFDNTLSLDGSTPNTLTADLDVGSQDLLNVGSINGASASGLSANLDTAAGISGDITTVAGISADVTQVAADTVVINAASANASAAAASASAASTSETNAAASEAAAAASYDSFDDRYLGAKASNPTVDNDGDPLITGALYFNTTSNEMRTWNGSDWVASFVTLSGALIATNNLSDLDNAAIALTNLGVTSTAAELNILDGVTSTTAELNILDGVTSTAAELNILDGVTSTTAELNILDGVTASTAEINHLVGVTSPIQTQIDNATPFSPTTVTGTTPSLDVGSFNFFDNGTLSGDTTVTFANVPTEARWSYSFIADLLTAYDLVNASFVQSFSVSAQETAPSSVFFKPDGTKMYVIGASGDDVIEYDLSTPWDVSTAVFLQLKPINAQDTSPTGLFFKPDGTKMYVVGNTGDDINEYDLSTPWDVSTAVFLQLFSVAAQSSTPRAVFFKPDGTEMYVTAGALYQYTLSTPWDVSTAVFLQFLSLSAQDTINFGIFFRPDGLKVYILGNNDRDVNEYDLTVPWDVSTAIFLQSFSVSAEDTDPRGLFFKPDGTKMYVVGNTGDDINEYDTFSGTALTLPASVQNPPTEDGSAGSKVTYDFYTLDGGTTVYLINEEVL